MEERISGGLSSSKRNRGAVVRDFDPSNSLVSTARGLNDLVSMSSLLRVFRIEIIQAYGTVVNYCKHQMQPP